MKTRCGWMLPALIAAFTAALATVALSQALRLPDDLAFTRGETSPGAVAFRHVTHVDPGTPACLGCHPGLFKMLQREALPAGATFHTEMENGRKCGACHDGATAFAADDCTACHVPD